MNRMSPHHILILSQYFWPETFRINDLALGLRDRGYDVSVLTGVPNYPQGMRYPGYGHMRWKDQLDGISIHRVPMITRGTSKGARLLANYFSFAASASVLGPLVHRKRVDSILLFQPSPATVFLPAIVLKRRFRARLLAWIQDPWPETLSAIGIGGPRWAFQSVERFMRWAYSHCDSVLIQSRAYRDSLRDKGVTERQMVYMPNWAEDIYRPVSCDPRIDRELPAGFRILHGGNLGDSHALDSTLDAIAKTSDIANLQWIFVGDGRRREWIQSEVHRRGLRNKVHFLGQRPSHEMPGYFAAADALFVTLAKRPIFECTIPSKIQCYLACGRPILASIDGEGARVLGESQSAWVSPAEDSHQLAIQIRDLVQTPAEERRRRGIAGREYYQRHFDRDGQLDLLESRLNDQVKENRCAA